MVLVVILHESDLASFSDLAGSRAHLTSLSIKLCSVMRSLSCYTSKTPHTSIYIGFGNYRSIDPSIYLSQKYYATKVGKLSACCHGADGGAWGCAGGGECI